MYTHKKIHIWMHANTVNYDSLFLFCFPPLQMIDKYDSQLIMTNMICPYPLSLILAVVYLWSQDWHNFGWLGGGHEASLNQKSMADHSGKVKSHGDGMLTYPSDCSKAFLA